MRRRGLIASGKIKDYLKFTARSSGTFTFSIPASVSPSDLPYIAYSINGSTWTITNNVANQAVTITTPTIAKDKYVLIKSEAKRTAIADSDNDSTRVSSTCDFDVSGNILSLLLGDNFKDDTTIDYYDSNEHDYMFDRLFKLARIVHANELKLPITGVPYFCFRDTFRECSIMTLGPRKIPITRVADSGLRGMFGYCSVLTNMPDLSTISGRRNVFGNRACFYMFEKCYKLTSVTPIALVYGDDNTEMFNAMFTECTKLSTPPILKIEGTTIEVDVCRRMFFANYALKTSPVFATPNLSNGSLIECLQTSINLKYITLLCTVNPNEATRADRFTQFISYGDGVFVKHINATWRATVRGYSVVPFGWKVIYLNPDTNKYYLPDKVTECDDHGNIPYTSKSDFIDIEYIENTDLTTAAPFIDTEIIATTGIRMEMMVKWNVVSSSDTQYMGNTQNPWFGQNGTYINSDRNGETPSTTEFEKLVSNTDYSSVKGGPLTIFRACNEGYYIGTRSYSCSCKLKYFKVYKNDILIGDFVPVRYKNSTLIGMWDNVTSKFFTSKQYGAFVGGPDVEN